MNICHSQSKEWVGVILDREIAYAKTRGIKRVTS